MRRRTFEEMITYFNQTVSEMDIDRKYKMTLLGIVTALLQKHDEELAKNTPKVNSDSGELISRQTAIDALWKALHEYEDKTEKQFQESEDLDVADWIQHRIFVQNMSDIDRQTIRDLPSAQPDLSQCWGCNCEKMEQLEPCEDVVSRNLVLSDVKSGLIRTIDGEDWKRVSENVRDIKALPSAQPTLHGYNIEHLELIARVLQKENLPPERVVEALTDIGRIVAIVGDEFNETLRKAVEQCMT